MAEMKELYTLFLRTEREKRWFEKAYQLSETFRKRAHRYDEDARFPFENFTELKEAKFLSLTVPKEYGGEEISLYEFLLIQETIGYGDGATALSLGWHLGIVMNLAQERQWEEAAFRRVCKEIIEHQYLINSAKTEKATGSPARGGKPETKAERRDGKWVITGRKTYTSMAPALDYFIVSATIEETGEVADFLIPREAKGVKIEKTWDTLGMRGTRSDDLVLEDVVLSEDMIVERNSNKKKGTPQGWLLHIPACYLGIALSARDEAIQFAETYQPNSLSHPIKDVPEVRRKVAEIDIELASARHFMYSVANMWDTFPEKRNDMGAELAAVKYVATNTAVKVVDLAMRIVGGHSLYMSSPLQRLYRDVRAGLHNPPSDDMTLSLHASRAFSHRL